MRRYPYTPTEPPQPGSRFAGVCDGITRRAQDFGLVIVVVLAVLAEIIGSLIGVAGLVLAGLDVIRGEVDATTLVSSGMAVVGGGTAACVAWVRHRYPSSDNEPVLAEPGPEPAHGSNSTALKQATGPNGVGQPRATPATAPPTRRSR